MAYEILRATDYNVRAQISAYLNELDGKDVNQVIANGDYTITGLREVVFVDSSVGPISITLPADPVTGQYAGVWDAGDMAHVNNITILRNGQTIIDLEEDAVIDMRGGRFDFVWEAP